MDLGQPLDQGARGRRGDPAVEVEGHVPLRAEHLARCPGARHHVGRLRRGGQVSELRAGVHLDRRQSRGDLLGDVLGDLRRRVAAHPAVDPHPVTHRPAEQAVDRHVQRLAGDVPQRLVNTGDRRGEHRAAAVEVRLGHRLPQALDVRRIAAHDELAEGPQRPGHGLRMPLQRGFAPADDALVGLDAHERPAGRDGELLQGGDPHAPTLRLVVFLSNAREAVDTGRDDRRTAGQPAAGSGTAGTKASAGGA